MGPKSTATPTKRKRIDSHESNYTTMATATDKARTRVSRACNECRKRKDRCDGCRPTCNNCSRLRRLCNYRPPKKRGLKTGYVRAIETLMGLVFNSIEDAEQWLCALLDAQQPAKPVFRLRVPTSDSIESLLDVWRQSPVMARIEQLLSSTETTEEEEETDDTSSRFDRRALDALALVTEACGTNDTATNDSPAYPSASPMDTDMASVDMLQPKPDNVITTTTPPGLLHMTPSRTDDALQSVVLPHNWQQLLDLYFASTHCWLPVSPKHHLLRTAYVMGSSSGSSTNLPQGDIAFLMAALSCVSSHPQIVGSAAQSQPTLQYPQEELLATTMNLVPTEPDACELGHVRALVLLALMYVRNNKQKAAWSTVGRAIYAAVFLDASPFRQTKHTTPVPDDVKRTLLCCIVLDSLVACWIHARPYFQRCDINSVGLLVTDGIEEWEPWQAPNSTSSQLSTQQHPARILSTFNHLMELVGLLNECLRLSSDCDKASLKTLTEAIQSSVNRLSPLSDSYPSIPFQILHLHFISTNIMILLLSKLPSLAGVELDIRLPNYTELLKLRISSEHYRATAESLAFLPTFRIYTEILCRSLNLREQSAAQSQDARHDFRALQNRFAELIPAQGDNAERLASTNKDPCLNATTHIQAHSTTYANHNIDLSSENVLMNLSVAFDDPTQFLMQPELSETLKNSEENSFPWATMSQAPQVEYSVSPQTEPRNEAHLNQATSFDSLMELLPGDMTDDGLFQSLTDLDAADW